MSSPNQPFSLLPESAQLISTCPLCKTTYHPLEVELLEERSEGRLVHLRCPGCAIGIIALFVAQPFGASSVGVMTDLGSTEVLTARDRESLSADQVLALKRWCDGLVKRRTRVNPFAFATL